MEINIWPWKSGDKGFLCMPLKSNIPDPNSEGKHPDWKLIKCPECGTECWESDDTRVLKESGVIALCTKCALKKGSEK